MLSTPCQSRGCGVEGAGRTAARAPCPSPWLAPQHAKLAHPPTHPPAHLVPPTHSITSQLRFINTSGFAAFRVSIDAHLMRVFALDAITIQV